MYLCQHFVVFEMFKYQSDETMLKELDAFFKSLPASKQTMLESTNTKARDTVRANAAFVEANYDAMASLLQGDLASPARGRASSLPRNEKSNASLGIKIAETVVAVGIVAAVSYALYNYFTKENE